MMFNRDELRIMERALSEAHEHKSLVFLKGLTHESAKTELHQLQTEMDEYLVVMRKIELLLTQA